MLAVSLLFAAIASAALFDKDAVNRKMDSMKDEIATKFDNAQDVDEPSSDDDGDSRTVIDDSETNTARVTFELRNGPMGPTSLRNLMV